MDDQTSEMWPYSYSGELLPAEEGENPLPPPHEIRQLLRELQLNRAELEWQRSELIRLREEVKSAQASREFFEKILNSLGDPVFVKDRERRLVLVTQVRVP